MGGRDSRARRNRWLPRGRLQVGSLVSTLVGLTVLLTWLGIHPGTTQERPVSSPGISTSSSTATTDTTGTTSTSAGPTAPVMTIAPASGPVGTLIQVNCEGFPPDVTLDFSIGGVHAATLPTNSSGELGANIRVPEGLSGRVAVVAAQLGTDSRAEAFFTVT